MTITREHLEKAAKAAGMDSRLRYCEAWRGLALYTPQDGYFGQTWNPMHDRGQLLDLAMACKIEIDPILDQLRYYETCPGGRDKCLRVKSVNCQDFPALAEAVVLACCEIWEAQCHT